MIRLAVFGKPVSQSLSPRIHGLFAQQFGLDVDYRAIEAEPGKLGLLVRELVNEGGRGCNITAPLKNEAWRIATRCSDAANRAQAANTLVFAGTEWFADNTDGGGLVSDLRRLRGDRLGSARICVLGAGGAAAGVLAALFAEKPEEVVIANRTRDRAVDLRDRHSDLGRVTARTPAELSESEPFDLLINATSLGHSGAAPDIEPAWLRANGLCYDMNYGPASAPLAKRCSEQGIRYSDGLGMLVGQAALSFRLWTGRSPETKPVLE
ncbi:MAG: shikimate dehydrogenase, partial [Gammaproteobacteria bacterium]|nr:shikimate dehydrogenase [Gammaproteobacteria bacterium]